MVTETAAGTVMLTGSDLVGSATEVAVMVADWAALVAAGAV